MLSPDVLYGILYLEINLTAIIIVILIRIRTNGITRMAAQFNFVMAMDSMAVFFASDTAAALIQAGILPQSTVMLHCFKALYFFSTALMCWFWFLYFEAALNTKFSRNRKAVTFSSLLVIVMAILQIINIFTGIFFSVDEACVYHRGALFSLQYVLSYIYVFISSLRALYRLLKRNDPYQRTTLIYMALFPVIPAIGGIIQFRYPQLPIVCSLLSITSLIMYLNWLENLISADPLTKLNNRKQLDYTYRRWIKEHSNAPLHLLMIDADHFKRINDTYGHPAGDEALIRISDAMRMSTRKSPHRICLSRYGGDEFVMLAICPAEDAQLIANNIQLTLAELNRQSSSGFDVSVSIGIAMAETNSSLKDLINVADEQLYEMKARTRNAANENIT